MTPPHTPPHTGGAITMPTHALSNPCARCRRVRPAHTGRRRGRPHRRHARTTREVIDHVYRLAGHRPRSFAAGATTLRLLGVVKPAMREYLHTLYQFTDRWVVDDTRFRTTFGDLSTPLDEALATTLRWYRDAASAQPAAGH